MKQQLVPYRRGHKLEILAQFEKSLKVVRIIEFENVLSSDENSISFLIFLVNPFSKLFSER
jgi:hypothetical protein